MSLRPDLEQEGLLRRVAHRTLHFDDPAQLLGVQAVIEEAQLLLERGQLPPVLDRVLAPLALDLSGALGSAISTSLCSSQIWLKHPA